MDTTERIDYPRVWRAVTEAPWAVLPSTLSAISEVLRLRGEGLRFTADDIRERLAAVAPGPRNGGRQQGAIAVLPLYGTIAHRMGSMAAASGGTSTEAFGQMFRQAMADPQVGAIVIDVDSPGGSVSGVPELAAEIFAARGQGKTITAVANSMAASAAYWIAAAADEVVMTPSGMVGSIGVLAIHEDVSAALDAIGIKTTFITAGRLKAEGHPARPLSDEALAAMQAKVDHFYGLFTADVAKYRGVPIDQVRRGFGEGDVVLASDAKRLGMVDAVASMDSTIERLMKRRPVSLGNGPQRSASEPFELRRRRLAIGAR